MIRLLAQPPSSLFLQQVVSLSQSSCVPPVELIPTGEVGGGGGRGAKSYDGEKAWSSVNHSILSGPKISVGGSGGGGPWWRGALVEGGGAFTRVQWWANLDQASKHLEVFRFRDLSPTPIP